MKTFRVAYKTPHNLFFRHIWRVVSCAVEGTEYGSDSYVFHTKSGKRIEVPVEGTVFVFGKRHNIV